MPWTTISPPILFSSPLLPATTTLSPFLPLRRRPSTALSASNSPSPVADRLLSAAAYLYPFVDGARYGRFLTAQLLPSASRLLPTAPATPASLLIFLGLYFAVVRNPGSFSRFVRFNAMQAIALDVLLIFPDLIERTFDLRGGVGLDILISLDSTVFLYLLVCLMYGSGLCLAGRIPRLPLVADAAERQVM